MPLRSISRAVELMVVRNMSDSFRLCSPKSGDKVVVLEARDNVVFSMVPGVALEFY